MMRRVLMGLAAVAVFGLLTACEAFKAETPRQQYAAVATSYATAMSALTALSKAGHLPLDAMEKVEHGRVLVKSALDTARVILDDPRRDAGGALYYIEQAVRGVANLVAVEQQYRVKKQSWRGPPGRAAPPSLFALA